MNTESATTVERKLFCSICEACCGLIATVADDKILQLRPDPEHPSSRGFACSKGIGFSYVLSDPDRVLEPLQRQPDGSFKPVSWDTALDDIAQRLRGIIDRHGGEAVGGYIGNPVGWNYAAQTTLMGMFAALGSKHFYTSGSVDVNNYFVVGQLLYGNNMINPIPDIHRTDFLVVLGANPVVSHGSMVTIGNIREAMLDITARGGRVVVIDPRRTETAELFEYLPIRPDSDAWLIAAMLKVIFDEDRVDHAAVVRQAHGLDSLRELVAGVTLERAQSETGIDAAQIAQLARDFAAAPSAAFYGRCGFSLGQFSTLTKYLSDALNIVTGNLDRPGGVVFGHAMIDGEKMLADGNLSGYDRWRTRVDGVPEVLGSSPIACLPREVTTPGRGQLHALFICSGNMVTSSPSPDEMESALRQLDLMVSLDPYVTETSRLAHYILPPTLWLERDVMPSFSMGYTAVPYAQWIPATVKPAGQARDDWWIVDQICRRIAVVPSPLKSMRLLGKLGWRPSPATLMDIALRLGPEGDLFGLRPRGLSRKKLFANPGGIKLMDQPPTGVLARRLHHADKRVHLAQPIMGPEMQRLIARSTIDPEYPLRIISLRELRSHNSWLHNIPKLMAGGRVQRLRIHPDDAAPLAIENGDEVEIASRHGAIRVTAWLSDEVMRGTVALPQGWGHRGGWKRAVAARGANYNVLASSRPSEFDRLSGQPRLNGIAVRISRARSDAGADAVA